MKPTITLALLLLSMMSQAQFEKKTLKAIEKQACFIPADTVVISQTQVWPKAFRHELFGNLVLSNTGGWASYLVNLDSAQSPKAYTDEMGFKRETYPFIQCKGGGHYFSAYEVSNVDYRLFIDWVRTNQPDKLNEVVLDSQGWKMPLILNAPFVKYYHYHPAYNAYPVVNVSHYQAKLYLEWLTTQYNQSSKRKYKQVKFRLPTEAEWMYAYLGGEDIFQVTNHGKFRQKDGLFTANFWNPVAASIIELQDSTFITFSDSALNFRNIHESHQTYPDTLHFYSSTKPRTTLNPFYTFFWADGTGTGTGFDYTTQCQSYWPNGFGLYNMAGNVAEFVAMDGIVKGGHWNSSGFYLMPNSRETYGDQKSSSPERGFRWVMEVIEE
ncbi:MAG: formylglycine-generating enzyme family protein [Bacteroidia bacterium]